MTGSCQILLICGSLREGSTNAALLATVAAVAPPGVSTRHYDGLAALPQFNPDDDRDPLPPAVADLRAAISAADAVLFSTPEYAGSLPGSVKNLLDWTVGGGEMYGRPVAWINVSTRGPGGAAAAHRTLRTVLGYTGSDVVEAACAHVPVAREAVDADGTVHDPDVRRRVAAAVEALAAHVRDGSGRDGGGAGRVPA